MKETGNIHKGMMKMNGCVVARSWNWCFHETPLDRGMQMIKGSSPFIIKKNLLNDYNENLSS